MDNAAALTHLDIRTVTLPSRHEPVFTTLRRVRVTGLPHRPASNDACRGG